MFPVRLHPATFNENQFKVFFLIKCLIVAPAANNEDERSLRGVPHRTGGRRRALLSPRLVSGAEKQAGAASREEESGGPGILNDGGAEMVFVSSSLEELSSHSSAEDGGCPTSLSTCTQPREAKDLRPPEQRGVRGRSAGSRSSSPGDPS